METITLYRPVGLYEMRLILEADSREFPPRHSEQPLFYPVLTLEYAQQIAHDWNPKDDNSGYAGFVTEFDVDADYLAQFEVHTVGASVHRELWIPAAELVTFNQHIQGRIRIIASYYGERYQGIQHQHNLWFADAIFLHLYKMAQHNPHDFHGEMFMNRDAILLNYAYWLQHDYSQQITASDKNELLKHIAETWEMKFPHLTLFGAASIE